MDNNTLRQCLFQFSNLGLGEVGVVVDFKPSQLRKPRQGTYIGDPVSPNIEMCQLCQPRQGTYITDLVVGECQSLNCVHSAKGLMLVIFASLNQSSVTFSKSV